jgi:hypothetical protein
MASKPPEGARWEDPPADLYRPDWQALAETLRAHPGRWLMVFEGERASLATAVALQHISCLRKADGFSMRTFKNTREAPRTCDLYMKWDRPKRSRKKD